MALPTTPGFYLDSLGYVWQLQRDGRWEYLGDQSADGSLHIDHTRAGSITAEDLLAMSGDKPLPSIPWNPNAYPRHPATIRSSSGRPVNTGLLIPQALRRRRIR